MRKNKKGFTLIELLAVIIILGVLMIIAIPSVTEYISSSRKKAYIDTAKQYISTVMTKVNQADSLKFFDEDTMYLVKVGHEKACVSLEKGGQSPFNDKWKYAYVGVTYNGSGYTYYFMSEDESGQGIAFKEQKDLKEDNYDNIVVTDTPNYSTDLYTEAGAKVYFVEYDSATSKNKLFTTKLENGVYVKDVVVETADKLSELAEVVPTKTVDSQTVADYSRLVVVNPATGGTCTYPSN